MTIQCGFFNSVSNDRLYQANDMTKPYELLVSNGVFATPSGTPSNYLQVYSDTGMNIKVKAGRGIFFDKWLINDADLQLTVSASEVVLDRIDSVVVKIDTTESVRAGTIIIKKGTPASTPVHPTLTRTTTIYEYRLADISVTAGATAITQMNIEDKRGSSDCGWVTSLVQQVDTSTLVAQWQSAYQTFYNNKNTEFDTWFAELHETVATQTLIRTFTSSYVTTVQDETVIPISIQQFNNELDILQVFINGLMMVKNVDYTVATNPASQITLVKPLDIGQRVSFVVYKSVDGSEAETVVTQILEIQEDIEDIQDDITDIESLIDIIKSTDDNGGVKYMIETATSVLDAFKSYGLGLHTFYSTNSATDTPLSNTAFRYLGHLTSVTPQYQGWLIAISTNGSMWINYVTNSVWRGWKMIYQFEPSTLYYSANGVYPVSGTTITPTKTLDQCRSGWMVLWGGYDIANSTPKDDFVQSVFIPKRNHKGANWNGEKMTFSLVGSLDSNGMPVQRVKVLTIYNDRIVSDVAGNGTGNNREVVLRAIYEY